MKARTPHFSVLLKEAVEALAIKAGGIYLDGTYGRGGHSAEILSKLGPRGQLYAVDKDQEAIAHAQLNFGDDSRVHICHQAFSELRSLIEKNGLMGKVDGILLDLGVSSPQLDNAHRGFSFQKDGPLDMRMDTNTGISAQEWIANTDEKDIAHVLWKYGEEKKSRRIAREIVKEREQHDISSTAQLAAIISKCIPKKEKHKNPATRSFQAIRIEINNELKEVESVLHQSTDVLAPGGRLSVISFHSLEDRIVKRFMREQSQGEKIPKEIPVIGTKLGPLKIIGKAQKATDKELDENPRSRSAVLRIAEKRQLDYLSNERD